jgi:hypothetical protein
MKKIFTLCWITLIAFTNNYALGQFPPHPWTAAIKVIGEDGNPVVGANVTVSYDLLSPTGQSGKGASWDEIRGLTDTNGMFWASHTDTSSGLGIVVEKAGYYNTHIGHQFYFDEKRQNPSFTSVLKKNVKPIPMYAKLITSIKFPVFDKPIGYDLTIGDWIAPYGKGAYADFLLTKNHAGKSSYTFAISFPNQGDGVQEFSAPLLLQDAVTGQSDLRSSSEAPPDGYQSQFVQAEHVPNRNLYFRVRTKLDSNGNVASACYGKIYGDLPQFTYYLNPTPNDRNIEFDPKQNLLSGLQSFEQVTAP